MADFSDVYGRVLSTISNKGIERQNTERMLGVSYVQQRLDDLFLDASNMHDIDAAKIKYTQTADEIYKGVYGKIPDNEKQRSDFFLEINNYANRHLNKLEQSKLLQNQRTYEYQTSSRIESLITQATQAAQEGNIKFSVALSNQAHGMVGEAVKTGFLTPEQAVHKHRDIKDVPLINYYVSRITDAYNTGKEQDVGGILKEVANTNAFSLEAKNKIFSNAYKIQRVYRFDNNYNAYLTDQKIKEIEFKAQKGEAISSEDLSAIPHKKIPELNARIEMAERVGAIVQPLVNATPIELSAAINNIDKKILETKEYKEKETGEEAKKILSSQLSIIERDPYMFYSTYKNKDGELIVDKSIKQYIDTKEYLDTKEEDKQSALTIKKLEEINNISTSLGMEPVYMSRDVAKSTVASLNSLPPQNAVKAIKNLREQYREFSDDIILQLEKEGLSKRLRVDSMIEAQHLGLYSRAVENSEEKLSLKDKTKKELWSRVIEKSDKYINSMYGAIKDAGAEADAVQNTMFLLAQQIQKETLVTPRIAANKAYDYLIGHKYETLSKGWFEPEYYSGIRYPKNVTYDAEFKIKLKNYVSNVIKNKELWFMGSKNLNQEERESLLAHATIKPLPNDKGVFILVEGNPVWTKNNKLYTMEYKGAYNE